jgi:hypothetical protein
VTVGDLLPLDLPEHIRSGPLARLLQISTRTLAKMSEAGILPPPLILGAHSRMYRVAEVRAALERRQMKEGTTDAAAAH